MTERGTFGPVVLLGLATAALAAVAGAKPWTEAHPPAGSCSPDQLPPGIVWTDFAQSAPLAGALALVLLASWGVLLVTRGRVRRLMAVGATVVATGFLAATIEAYWSLRDLTERKVAERIGTLPEPCDHARIWMADGWWHTALVAGALAVVAGLLAVRLAPHWPEMGSRYDAPSAGGTVVAVPLEEQSSMDLWKSLDAGHDPTIGPEDTSGPQS